jgi:hypothetical protein
MALCMAENQGDISQVNQLISNYNLVSVTDINKLANNILIKENCTTILYPNYAK